MSLITRMKMMYNKYIKLTKSAANLPQSIPFKLMQAIKTGNIRSSLKMSLPVQNFLIIFKSNSEDDSAQNQTFSYAKNI